MAEILTGRVEGNHIALDEALSELDGRRVRVTVEPLDEVTASEALAADDRQPWTVEAEMRWLREHRSEYAGQWVALDRDRLVATGSTARDVYWAAHAEGVTTPFVEFVESAEEGAFWGGWV